MGAFRFFGIPEAVAREVRESLRAPGYGHPAHREQAHGYGPCRLCLRTFRVGADERILFTYNPFQDAGSLPAPGPVFIHAEPCARYDALELPPDFRALPIVSKAIAGAGDSWCRSGSPGARRRKCLHGYSRPAARTMRTCATPRPAASWRAWTLALRPFRDPVARSRSQSCRAVRRIGELAAAE